jgi:hypothetical protein
MVLLLEAPSLLLWLLLRVTGPMLLVKVLVLASMLLMVLVGTRLMLRV